MTAWRCGRRRLGLRRCLRPEGLPSGFPPALPRRRGRLRSSWPPGRVDSGAGARRRRAPPVDKQEQPRGDGFGEDGTEGVAVQRPVLPGHHVLQHGVADPADGVPADLNAVDLQQMTLDVPDGHALDVQGDHLGRQSIQAALPLRNSDRLETAVAIPGHPQIHLADIGGPRLGIGAVAAVARASALDGVALIAEMVGHLDVQPGLQHPAHQRGQQTVIPAEFDSLLPGPSVQRLSPRPHGLIVAAHPLEARTRRRRHRRLGTRSSHNSDPFWPTTRDRGPPDHAGYTISRTLPRGRAGSRPAPGLLCAAWKQRDASLG